MVGKPAWTEGSIVYAEIYHGAHGERLRWKGLRIPTRPNPNISIYCRQQQRGREHVNRKLCQSEYVDTGTERPTDNGIHGWKRLPLATMAGRYS